MIARWFTSVRIFLVCLVGFVLALVILALGHDLLMVFIVNTLNWGKYVVRFTNMAYYYVAGFVCVAYYILIHEFLSHSARKGLLLRSTLQTIGSQLLLIGLFQAGLMSYGFYPSDWQMIVMVAVELLAGGGMLFFAHILIRKGKLESR